MLPQEAATDRADQIFRIGPETLVVSSSTIVAGRVAHYHKEVLKFSQPGPDGFPLESKITGQLVEPVALKGSLISGPISFSRTEIAFMSPAPPQNPLWEQDYGELAPDGRVVLFFSGTNSASIHKVLPSGAADQDLAALVKEIVSIQQISDPNQRTQRWLAYLNAGPSAEGYRVTLRSLVRSGTGWQHLESPLRKILTQSGIAPDVRAFTFSIIAFHLTQNGWSENNNAALDLLCTSFSGQKDSKLALQNLGSLSLLLNYANQQPLQDSRRPLREKTVKCLRSWATLGFADPSLAEEYKRIRQQYAIQ
jgi:hypothetical protein